MWFVGIEFHGILDGRYFVWPSLAGTYSPHIMCYILYYFFLTYISLHVFFALWHIDLFMIFFIKRGIFFILSALRDRLGVQKTIKNMKISNRINLVLHLPNHKWKDNINKWGCTMCGLYVYCLHILTRVSHEIYMAMITKKHTQSNSNRRWKTRRTKNKRRYSAHASKMHTWTLHYNCYIPIIFESYKGYITVI